MEQKNGLRSSFYNIFRIAVVIIFELLLIYIIFMVIGFGNTLNYTCKKTFELFNYQLLIIGLILVASIMIVLRKFNDKLEKILSKDTAIIFATCILIMIQIVISCNVYFQTGWDVEILLKNAQKIASNDISSITTGYFSIYPNNIFLLWLFSLFYKFFALFNVDALLPIIMLQCVISSLSGYFIFKIVKEFTNSFTSSWIAWGIYIALLGVSPWLVIPYSDSMGLIFPIAIIRIYQIIKNKRFVLVKWFSIGIFSFVGYMIKPQIFIVFIAIIVIEAMQFVKEKDCGLIRRLNIKSLISLLLSILVCFGIYVSAFNLIGIKINKEKKLGAAHFVMMGLNTETNGVYSLDDVKFSGSFSTKKDRNAANIEEIKSRLDDMGISGLTKHTGRKTLVVFADGTFSWGMEGNFYKGEGRAPFKNMSEFLKSVLWSNGKYYNVFSTAEQFMWIMVITFCLAAPLCVKKIKDGNKKTEVLVIMLSIIGLTLFELIFEARARHLISYIPLYIVLSVISSKYLFGSIFELKNKFKIKKANL